MAGKGEDLVHRLVHAVNSLHAKYGSNSGLAIESDHIVADLCRSLEHVFLHGIKVRKTNLAKYMNKAESNEVLIWDFIKRFLSRSDLHILENDASLPTGIGRFRSWLRRTLNDGLLEKKLNIIVEAEPEIKRTYYEDFALFLDTDLCGNIPQIVGCLSESVLFSLDCDRSEFNDPIFHDRTVSATVVNTQTKRPASGKRKMKRPQILDDEEEGDGSSSNRTPDTTTVLSEVAPDFINASTAPTAQALLDKDSLFNDISLVTSEPSDEDLKVIISATDFSSSEGSSVSDYSDEADGDDVLPNLAASSEEKFIEEANNFISAKHLTMGDSFDQSFEYGTVESGSSKYVKDSPFSDQKQGDIETEKKDDTLTKTVTEDDSLLIDSSVSSSGSDGIDIQDNQVHVGENNNTNDPETIKTSDISQREKYSNSLEDKVRAYYDVEDEQEDNAATTTSSSSSANPVKLAPVNTECTMIADSPTPTSNLPRSSVVISKPYSAAVREVLKRKSSKEFHRSYSETGSSKDRPNDTASSALSPPAPRRAYSLINECLQPIGAHHSPNQEDLDEMFNADVNSVCSDISSSLPCSSFRSVGDGIDLECGASSQNSPLNTGDLRSILKDLIQQRDEIQLQNRKLEETLGREVVIRDSLQKDIKEIEESYKARKQHDQAIIRGLQRENQMLKQQLKKYVSVIQQIRRDENMNLETDLTSVIVEVPVVQPLQLPVPTSVSYIDSSALEQKLAQVSEMHGELMELNQELVTKNLAREKQLEDLEKKLRVLEAKGLPRKHSKNQAQVEQTTPRKHGKNQAQVEQATPRKLSLSGEYDVVDSPLLQIWIPAAMLRGSGSKTYHVYQIIVQIPGIQWTVHRRFAEFRTFHKKLVRRHPFFHKLVLPARTHLNHKVPAVVEERRRKLEVYLQTVASNLADQKKGIDTETMNLEEMPSKLTVATAIHFLRETKDDL